MSINIEMPKLSDTMTEGTLVKWLKKEGDVIEIGDIIAEVETDKATMEMEAFDDGTLSDIRVQEGEKVKVGEVLAVLLEEGESAGDDGDAGSSEEKAADPERSKEDQQDEAKKASAQAVDKKPKEKEQAQANSEEKASGDEGERLRVSPLARKLAKEFGLDLHSISGTGPSGRIVKADIMKVQESEGEGAKVEASAKQEEPSAASAPSAAPAPQAIQPHFTDEDEKIPLTSMRQIIADRLLTSKATIPHFYLHLEADAAPLMKMRKQINDQAEATHGNKYTVNDFILKAVVIASQEVPAVNASFAGDSIVRFANVGLSVAIAVEDGLVTPVIKNAQEKSLLQISKEVKDLAQRARDKKLKPNEFDGGTVTVSNLGAFGIDFFDAIINPPQAAIVSVGGISQKPVVENGEIVIGTRMALGLSADHRVVDGAVAAEFLAVIKKYVENPTLMLI